MLRKKSTQFLLATWFLHSLVSSWIRLSKGRAAKQRQQRRLKSNILTNTCCHRFAVDTTKRPPSIAGNRIVDVRPDVKYNVRWTNPPQNATSAYVFSWPLKGRVETGLQLGYEFGVIFQPGYIFHFVRIGRMIVEFSFHDLSRCPVSPLNKAVTRGTQRPPVIGIFESGTTSRGMCLL